MLRRSRAVWLPVVAVVLPCLFIGALAVNWLSVEREATVRRSEQAARDAVAGVSRALADALAKLAPEIEQKLRVARAPFAAVAFPSPRRCIPASICLRGTA